MIAYLATLDLSTLIRRSRVGCLMAVASLCCDAFATVQGAEPMYPSAAIADFVLPLGYRVELVAAEPQVVDPVAIAFDHQGRLWVIEMRDYPTPAKGAKPSSRIRILRDNDGDGVFETADTFAADLPLPTGLQLWKSGAIVTLAGAKVVVERAPPRRGAARHAASRNANRGRALTTPGRAGAKRDKPR